MRSLLTKGGTVAIIVIASGAAAGQKPSGPIHAILRIGPPTEAPMPKPLNHMSVVNRIWSLDRNGDDRIARDELPERMEDLIGRGDKNQDGFLNLDEVFALVEMRPGVGAIRFSVRGPANLS